MLIQKQPNRWSCLPTSFAMVLGVPVETIIKKIGHDGSEKINNLEEPLCRRSFHIQELIDICLDIGYGVTEIQTHPCIDNGFEINLGGLNRLVKHLSKSCGVLIGETTMGKRHAVAWDKENIYDPNGEVYSINRFVVESFFRVQKVKLNGIEL